MVDLVIRGVVANRAPSDVRRTQLRQAAARRRQGAGAERIAAALAEALEVVGGQVIDMDQEVDGAAPFETQNPSSPTQ